MNIFFNDDDIEKEQTNWKNSEVMRIFAEQYLDKITVSEQSNEGKNSANNLAEDKFAQDDNLDDHGSMALMEEEENLASEVMSAMDKIASLSNEYGNEKVRYMLDIAKGELERILHTGEENVL